VEREREEERRERRERERVFGQRRNGKRGEKKKNAFENLFSLPYPFDVSPHLLEQGRCLGGLGVGAALEVGLVE